MINEKVMRSDVDVTGDVIVYISYHQFRHHGAMTRASQHHQLLTPLDPARHHFLTILHMCFISQSPVHDQGGLKSL